MQQFKQANGLFGMFANAIEAGKEMADKISDYIDSREYQHLSLTYSAIKPLIAADPVLAGCSYVVKRQRMMFPTSKRGYTIDYSKPYWSGCPHHGCKTYTVEETRYIVWCPMCMDFLEVEG